MRAGDALETLCELPGLAPGALVLADLSPDDPNLDRYCAHMNDPGSGYATVTVPLDAGVVVSTRLTSS